MKKLFTILCLIVAVLHGSSGMSWGADPYMFDQMGEDKTLFFNYMKHYQAGEYEEGIRILKPLVEKGYAAAQFQLGWMHHKGQGVTQDITTAKELYRLAAEQGLANAQYNLGDLLRSEKNYKIAVKWFNSAAEQGNSRAQADLALMYGKGDGVQQSNIFAYMWSSISASNNNTPGSALGIKVQALAEQQLSSSELKKAKDLARECVRKKYKGCDVGEKNDTNINYSQRMNFCKLALDLNTMRWKTGLSWKTAVEKAKVEGLSENYCSRAINKNKTTNDRDFTTTKSKASPTNNSSNNDIQSRLSKLKKLEDAGLITKKEAATKRKAILDSL
jgi:TPR repeat protein